MDVPVKKKTGNSRGDVDKVRVFRNAVPRDIHQVLSAAFAPASPFWRETNYEERYVMRCFT